MRKNGKSVFARMSVLALLVSGFGLYCNTGGDLPTVNITAEDSGITLVAFAGSNVGVTMPPDLATSAGFAVIQYGYDFNMDGKFEGAGAVAVTEPGYGVFATEGLQTMWVQAIGSAGETKWFSVNVDVKPAIVPTAIPRNPLIIDFSETWCGPCGMMQDGLDHMLANSTSDLDPFIWNEHHSTDEFAYDTSYAYAGEYTISGYPTVVVDGVQEVQWYAADLAQRATMYENSIMGRLQVPGKASIQGSAYMGSAGSAVSIMAAVTFPAGQNPSDWNLRVAVAENELEYAAGTRSNDFYEDVVRYFSTVDMYPSMLAGVTYIKWISVPLVGLNQNSTVNTQNLHVTLYAENKTGSDLNGLTVREVGNAWECGFEGLACVSH